MNRLTFKSHYLRAGRSVSWAAALLAAAWPACAQYPGQLAKSDADKDKVPILRAVAVLEWTGDPGKPQRSRLVPLTVFDGQDLQDGSIYLARPQPLALSGEVEYEIRRMGRNIGLFDIENAGQEQGFWVGYGKWKPLPPPKKTAAPPLALVDDSYDDKPVLHRKHHADDAGQPGAKDSGGSKGSGEPTLHRKDSGDDDSGQAPAPDPDRPTLHKAKASAPDDSDRPTLKKEKQEDIGHVESLPEVTDPDRPRLKRGKSEGSTLAVTPSLLGLPPDMQQAVAVSDARDLPEHPWVFHWSNPADELAMKAKLEDAARTALGLTAPPVQPAPKTAAKSAKARTARAKTPPPPAPLADEQFRVFELAYGAGATLVLSAHTDAPPVGQKFVTLIAQPDFYGGLVILLKNVTDAAHLDDTPRMRLVDAVDAESDNRGELVFELRGATQRQFALYRVLRGRAEAIFTSAPSSLAAAGAASQGG